MAIEQFSDGNESQKEKVEASSHQLNEMNNGLYDMSKTSAAITDASLKSTEIAGKGEELVQKTVGQMNSIDRSVKQAEAVVKGLEAKSKDITSILRVINRNHQPNESAGAQCRDRSGKGRRIGPRLFGSGGRSQEARRTIRRLGEGN